MTQRGKRRTCGKFLKGKLKAASICAVTINQMWLLNVEQLLVLCLTRFCLKEEPVAIWWKRWEVVAAAEVAVRPKSSSEQLPEYHLMFSVPSTKDIRQSCCLTANDQSEAWRKINLFAVSHKPPSFPILEKTCVCSCTETWKAKSLVEISSYRCKKGWIRNKNLLQSFFTKQAFQYQVIYTFKSFGIYAIMMSVNSKRAATSQTADFGLRAAIFTACVDTLPVFVIQVGDIRARSSCWRGFCCEAACWLQRSVKCASEDIA